MGFGDHKEVGRRLSGGEALEGKSRREGHGGVIVGGEATEGRLRSRGGR